MAIEILNKSGEVIYTHQADTLNGADLRGVDLKGANLMYAYLRGSDLHGADLRGANLRGSDLRGSDLHGADLRRADLRRADLRRADLSGANLRYAELHNADLRCADLHGADLRGSDLHGSDLHGSDLRGANLRGAIGFDPRRINQLYFLTHQVHPLVAYKLVTEDYTGPFHPSIEYLVGTEVSVEKWNDDPTQECGSGINLATLDWVIREWSDGYRILQVECYPAEGICVPNNSDGKFRVKRCNVLKEMDLVELGLKDSTSLNSGS